MCRLRERQAVPVMPWRKKVRLRDWEKAAVKHLREKGEEGTPLRELQQVLPGHNRGQLQVLLRELRDENRIYCVGKTSAGRWFAREHPTDSGVNIATDLQ